MPTQVNIGNLEHHSDHKPGSGEENMHHMGDMDVSMSTEFTPQMELPRLPIMHPHGLGMESGWKKWKH